MPHFIPCYYKECETCKPYMDDRIKKLEVALAVATETLNVISVPSKYCDADCNWCAAEALEKIEEVMK